MLNSDQKKLRRALHSRDFKLIILFYNHFSVVADIKTYLTETFPDRKTLSLTSENSTYEDLSKELYNFSSGIVYIEDFETILSNDQAYPGFNQRRDKLAKHDLQIIAFMPLYDEQNLLTLFQNNLPDLWEFRTLVLRIEKKIETQELISQKNFNTNYSSLGGFTSLEKRRELNRLLEGIKTLTKDQQINSYEQISLILTDLGEYEKALKFQLKVITLKQKEKQNAQLANSFNHLSLIYSQLGNFNKALLFQKKALDIRTYLYKHYHLDIAESYNNLSVIYMNLGDLKNALTLHQKSIDILTHLPEKDSLPLSTCYSNLSLIYLDSGDFDKALKAQFKALDIRKELLNEKHPDLLTSYSNLSMIYLELGQLNKALNFQLKATNIISDILEKSHPVRATYYSNLSLIYHELGDLNLALKFQLKSLEIREKRLGSKHPDTAISYNNLSIIFLDQNKLNQAAKYNNKAITILKNYDLAQHTDFQTMLENQNIIQNRIQKNAITTKSPPKLVRSGKKNKKKRKK